MGVGERMRSRGLDVLEIIWAIKIAVAVVSLDVMKA